MNESTHDPRLDGILGCLNDLYSTVSCGICLDTLDRPLSTKCGHSFCQTCIHKVVVGKRGGGGRCPLCNERSVSKRSLEDDETTAVALDLFAAVRNAVERETNGMLRLTTPPFGKKSLEMTDAEEEQDGVNSAKSGAEKSNLETSSDPPRQLETSKPAVVGGGKKDKSRKPGAKQPTTVTSKVRNTSEKKKLISPKRGNALREISNTKSTEHNPNQTTRKQIARKRKRDHDVPENVPSSEERMEVSAQDPCRSMEDVIDNSGTGLEEASTISGEPAPKKARSSAKGNRITFQLKGKVSVKATLVKKKARQRERKIPFILMGSLVKELETPAVASEYIYDCILGTHSSSVIIE